MIFTNRSAYQQGLDCRRKRWWGYEYRGSGLTRKSAAFPLWTGMACHYLSQAIATGDLEKAIDAALGDYRKEIDKHLGLDLKQGDLSDLYAEQRALVEALMRAWWRVRAPQWRAEWELVDYEQEAIAQLGEVTLQTRSDMLVRRLADNELFVWSWKTTGYVDAEWQAKWDHDLQRLTEIVGDEARTRQRIRGVVVEGLYKGRKATKEQRERRRVQGQPFGLWGPPLAWGYHTAAGDYTWEWKPKAEQFAVWREDFPGQRLSPVAFWIEWLPEEILLGHFIQTVPLLADDLRLASVKAQFVAEERRLAESRQLTLASADVKSALDEHWPQNFHQCHRYSGAPCEFLELCFDESGEAELDPLGTGLYKARLPHHPKPEEEA